MNVVLALLLLQPTHPVSLDVRCPPGAVRLPSGQTVQVRETMLHFDPPETTTLKATLPTPRDHHSSYDAWDPWPTRMRDGTTLAVGLSPKHDPTGTPILGGLFRAIDPQTVTLATADGKKTFTYGEDFIVNADWGQIAGKAGRLGPVGPEQKLLVTAKANLQRLDLVQVTPAGKVTVKKGVSRLVCPALPEPDAGCLPIAGVYIAPWPVARNPHFDKTGAPEAKGTYAVTAHEIFPIQPAKPTEPIRSGGVARTLKKLRDGGEVRIAFLGDSITLGAEAGPWWDKKAAYTAKDKTYRGRVIHGLKQRFAQATVTPIEAYRGGSTVGYALRQLDGAVLPKKPDLAVVAFGANDAAGSIKDAPRNPPAQFAGQLKGVVKKLRDAGVEVLIVVEMPQLPWKKDGAAGRWGQYRQAMLDVAEQTGAAVADVSTEWENLAKRGIPPFSQLHNNINHPGAFGHRVFADVILRCFPATGAIPAPTTAPARKNTALIAQPTTIPGKWKPAAAALPDLKTVLAAPPDGPPYGLYLWADEYVHFRDNLKKVGWKHYRVGGPMDDKAMRAIVEDDVEVVKTLSGRRYKTGTDTDEAFIAAYVRDVEAFLERYGPGGTFFKNNPDLPHRPIRLVEIWNEPNFQYMIPDEPSPKDPAEARAARLALETRRETLYAKLLPATYAAIKKRWPDVKVVGFSAGGASAGDIRFLQHVHDLNPAVATSYDILATHPYVEPVPPETDHIRSWGSYSIAGGLDSIRKITAKPVWYTEIGWPISHAAGGQYPDRKPAYATPALQAAYIVRLYALAMRLGVGRVHIMHITDTDHFNAGFMTRTAQTWRPSAHATQTMIRLMPNPRLIEAIHDGADGLYAWRFQRDVEHPGPQAILAWNVAGPKTVSLPVGGLGRLETVRVVDMLGHEVSRPVVDGHVTVEVGPCPVYLLGKDPV